MDWIDHLPGFLRAAGPRGLVWGQWLLPVLLVVALVIGVVLGRVSRALLTSLARRTRVTWDDQVAAGIGGPLSLVWTVAAARLLTVPLALPVPWEKPIHAGLRTALFVAFFWFLLRVVKVGGDMLTASSWALSRPASRSLVPLGARATQVAVLAMGVVAILADLGFAVTSLVTGLGIGGLALALAAQKTVENLFGAFSMGVDQPFQVGDFVLVEGVMGTVEVIGLRSTRIRTLDRTLVTLPNGKLAEMRIETFAARDRIRFATTLGLARSTTAAQVRQVLAGLDRTLRAHPKLWTETVTVRFKQITANELDIEVMAWFATQDWNEFLGIREELLLGFLGVVEDAGTSFALPTRAVRLEDGNGRLTSG
jgi:MscS family membrane protein